MKNPILDRFYNRNRFAVILAGGDGTRLRPFVHKLRGDSLPKQYVKFFNEQSLLEVTLQRIRRLVPPEKQFVVVTENHLDHPEVAQQLNGHPAVGVTVQPRNRDTGLGLLLPLAQLHRRHPDAIVAVFPSDHFIEQEGLFLTHVEAAYNFVERENSKIVLLGIAPTAPETDYGYILPNNRWHNAFPFGAREVARFVEKPDAILARKLIRRSGFWNTMVMVFKVSTVIEHVRTIVPQAYRMFEGTDNARIGAEFEKRIERAFDEIAPFNFSKDLLETLAAQQGRALVVLPVRGVNWTDWGSEERIMKTVKFHKETRIGLESSGAAFNSLLKECVAGSA
jgi:mannose-1-phosphate guanylyltransferase